MIGREVPVRFLADGNQPGHVRVADLVVIVTPDQHQTDEQAYAKDSREEDQRIANQARGAVLGRPAGGDALHG